MEYAVGQVIKGYELGERIGAGGFGAVYKAFQSTVGREVAIKIVLPHFSNQPDFIRRFETEAHLIARLEHLHIVPLYDYWRDADGAYLVMRWLRGGSLRDILLNGPVELETTVLFIDQIASALSSAHRNHIIHRDLKPGNILLDEDDNAYLADFGIAKDLMLQQGITEADSIVGSPDYLAPEQARSEPVTPQTDIYSLGVVLYEMLTGEHPFVGAGVVERLYKHLNDPLPIITTLPVNVADEVNGVIQKATAKDPKDRFSDALEFAAALRQAAHISKRESIVETLTQREHEILQLIVAGHSNKEIAEELVVTVMTIKWYITQIYRKLGVRSRVQAIVRARELDLLGSRVNEATSPVETPAMANLNLQNPYKGLRAFQAADNQDFFGREKLIAKLIKRMSENSSHMRFLAIVGPSGSGKSSLVKAGLIPALWRGDISGSEKWFVVEVLPGSSPVDELEVALARIAANQAGNLSEQLHRDKRGLVRAASLILPDDGSELVLMIDQFEEVFTLVEDEAERIQFLDLLHAAVTEPRSRVRVVITLRADFYDRPLHYPHFGELIRSRMETVLPMSAQELESAIKLPAERMGVSFEPGLIASIISEVNYQPGALPLLQYALTELFEQREGHLLTQQAYNAIGKTIGALAKRADEIYVSLSEAGQEMTRQMFLRLVTLGEGTEDTRRRVARSEIMAITEDKDAMEEIIDTYVSYRLLSMDNDPETRSPTIELAHEAILREWERLRSWLNDSRDEIRLQRQIITMVNDWQRAERDTSFLAHGSRLEQFEHWMETTHLALTKREREFLRASIAERERTEAAEQERREREQRLEQRSQTFLRGLVAVLLLATLGAFVLTSVAVTNANAAQNNFITAERIRLAAQAQNVLSQGEGGDLPALLALRSLELGYSPEADAALLSALSRGFTRQIYVGHTDAVRDAIFSPDGRLIASAAVDNSVRLWNAQTGEEIRQFTGHTEAPTTVAFSSDNQRIISTAIDDTIRMWSVQTGEELLHFKFDDNIWIGIPSPDDKYILAGFLNGNALLIDANTGDEIRRFEGHTGLITMADFSQDGQYVLTTSSDQTARIWDVKTGRMLRNFTGHIDSVNGGSFSPDGQFVITAGSDNTARIWNVATGQEIRRLIGHSEWLIDGRITADNRFAFTTSNDRTARLWDIGTGREIRQFIGHTNDVWPGRFSADERFVLTGSSDRTLRLWDIESITEPRRFSSRSDFTHQNEVLLAQLDNDKLLTIGRDRSLTIRNIESGLLHKMIYLGTGIITDSALAPDQQYAATVDGNGILELWSIETGELSFSFQVHNAPIKHVRFSPDGKYLLTSSDDTTAKLWTRDGELISEFTGHEAPVEGIAFSADGRYIVTGSQDQSARLWNAETGEQVQQFNGHTGTVLAVDVFSDGMMVVTGSSDQTLRLWDVESGRELKRFSGHSDEVMTVKFAPGNDLLISGSVDQTVRLWSLETGQTLRQLIGHAGTVLVANFSSDGRFIVTGDTEFAYLWQADINSLIDFTCSLLSRDFTAEERIRYNIVAEDATCLQNEDTDALVFIEPTWTAVVKSQVPQWTPIPPEPVDQIVEFVFMNDRDTLAMGMPPLDVYQQQNDGLVSRIPELTEAALKIPLYGADVSIAADFNPPFELGPWPQGVSLGFTLEEWISAEGRGTYTVQGDRARLDLVFENLRPNSVYTLWCVEMTLVPEFGVVRDPPCGAPDGSESIFTTDENGYGEYSVEIAPFPPSTQESFPQVALAYHSDGQTYGARAGDFGKNVHVQMYYDFLPPSSP